MTRFILAALVAAIVVMSFAPVAGAAVLSCRKSGGDGTPAAAPMKIAQPSDDGTSRRYKLENVMVSS